MRLTDYKKCWIARCNFPNKTPFVFGNIVATTEEEARVLLDDALDRSYPFRPTVEAVVPGALFFEEGDFPYPAERDSAETP